MASSVIKGTYIHEIKMFAKWDTIPANQGNVSVTLDVPSGYKFMGWVEARSNGWVGDVYVERPDLVTSNVWAIGNTATVDRIIVCYYYAYK